MRALTSLTVALLLSACLSACSSDEDQPTILAPASPSPAVSSADSSASTEVNPPVMPPEAEAQTADGAMAFVRHYFAVVDYAYATGDTTPLAAVSDPECLPCAAIKEMVDATLSGGGSYVSEVTQVLELSVPDSELRGAVEVHALYWEDGAIRLNGSGAEVGKLESARGDRLRFVLTRADSSWLVYDYSEMPA